MEIVIVLVVIGVVALVAWPFLARGSAEQPRTPADQGEVTDTSVIPPARPDRPVPGSRTDRERHGMP